MEITSFLWRLGITIIFVLINGFFVAAEFALVKVRPMRMATLAKKGDRRARLVEQMLDKLDLYLSSCQLGITISSLILGWLAEPAVARLLIAMAEAVGLVMAPHLMHFAALAIALTVVTILHMTLGEQGPKIWAIQRAEMMAVNVAYPLMAFTFVFRPLIWIVNSLSNRLLRTVGLEGGEHSEQALEAAEIKAMLAHSATAGHISRRQRELAENVLSITRLEVRHLLVPRTKIVWLDLDQPLDVNLTRIRESGHSRFPLCRKDLDQVEGVIHVKSVFAAIKEDGPIDLTRIAMKPVFVPENQPVARMIRALQHAGSGCAIVLDEYGGVAGAVFLDDALEEIVGPLPDEFDQIEENHHQVGPGTFELHGDMALPFACEVLGIDVPGDEDTIGGYVVGLLKRIPETNDAINVGPYYCTVSEVQDHRAFRLRFERPDQEVEKR